MKLPCPELPILLLSRVSGNCLLEMSRIETGNFLGTTELLGFPEASGWVGGWVGATVEKDLWSRVLD